MGVVEVISAASQGAVDAHGIGMGSQFPFPSDMIRVSLLMRKQEQKPFDLGTSVAKVAHAYASPPTPSPNHP